jgi:hypothetical protein
VRASRVVAALTLVIGALAARAPSAGATTGPCKVTNPRTHHVYVGSGSNLQLAIDAAIPGTNLRVKGRCVGDFTIEAKLELTGVPTGAFPSATLDGNGSGTVLTVGAVAVVLQNLTMTHGSDGSGGGIENNGTLTVKGASSVTGNAAPSGSGGGIENNGTLILIGSSSVSGNTSDGPGAGIDNNGSLTLKGSSSVSSNTAGGAGGGIYTNGTLALNDTSSVSGNVSGGAGGGIDNAGTATLNGASSVSGNTSGGAGGGILNVGTLDACDTWTGAIAPNSPDDPPPTTPVFC